MSTKQSQQDSQSGALTYAESAILIQEWRQDPPYGGYGLSDDEKAAIFRRRYRIVRSRMDVNDPSRTAWEHENSLRIQNHPHNSPPTIQNSLSNGSANSGISGSELAALLRASIGALGPAGLSAAQPPPQPQQADQTKVRELRRGRPILLTGDPEIDAKKKQQRESQRKTRENRKSRSGNGPTDVHTSHSLPDDAPLQHADHISDHGPSTFIDLTGPDSDAQLSGFTRVDAPLDNTMDTFFGSVNNLLNATPDNAPDPAIDPLDVIPDNLFGVEDSGAVGATSTDQNMEDVFGSFETEGNELTSQTGQPMRAAQPPQTVPSPRAAQSQQAQFVQDQGITQIGQNGVAPVHTHPWQQSSMNQTAPAPAPPTGQGRPQTPSQHAHPWRHTQSAPNPTTGQASRADNEAFARTQSRLWNQKYRK